MQPAPFRQADFLLVEINNAKSTSPAVSSGKERGLLSRTAAGNRAYCVLQGADLILGESPGTFELPEQSINIFIGP